VVAAQPEMITTSSGTAFRVTEVDETADGPLLHKQFNRLLDDGEGYPQKQAIPYDEFRDYWIDGKTIVIAAWSTSAATLVGSYFLKPNGYGRAAHVANGGYFVAKEHRGSGVGEALVRHSMATARDLGFDALQFNFVFESNPARRLYERMGFEQVGRVPEVIDGEAVLIYWRRLD
jgi:GNAT superfamily N-acetyltransferase